MNRWSFCCPKFLIQNELGETVLKVDGPVCGHGFCNWCGDVDFVVSSPETGEKVGNISKQWSGLSKEVFTDADNFGISFPATLDAKVAIYSSNHHILSNLYFFR